MTRTKLATLLSRAIAGLFSACVAAQLLTHFCNDLPLSVYVAAFLSTFAVAGAIGILQIRVEMIEREWPFFTYESARTLFRRFPLWTGMTAAAMLVWHALILGQPQTEGQSYPLIAGILALEFGALRSLQRQPWLLDNLACPDGHPIAYYNRFCPTCGVALPKIPGSA
jgi:hypothetical protein